jgi:tetratricopeptide (TPR) repeat protein
VPIDRAVTLRNAEKLIRQGKLEAAIEEFVRIVDDQPQDWNAKNTLGDLHARAGQVDKAIDQYMEIADNLNHQGSVAKAGAIYKKILKLRPDHERGLWQVSEILANQKLYVDARANLNKLIELRRAKGDSRGALQAKVRLGSLDPEDHESRLAGASARIEMGDVAGAMRDFKEIAAGLSEKGRQTEAIDVLRQAGALNADDEEVREKLFDVHVAAGDYASAREFARTVEQFRMIAAAQEAQGQADDALATLRQAAGTNPHDAELATELATKFLARGDAATASEYLTLEVAGTDPALLMTVADLKLRGDSSDEGLAIVKRLLGEDPSRREQIALLGWTVAERKPAMGFAVVELAADAAVAQGDWPGAAAALQEFVTRVPNHIPALMRLVEICVDGGLEATMYSAQGQLADAYIAAGAATEAHFIAEDLVAREPWDNENIERFRRALVLLGEPDPDALIASRLSGDSPFTSTDLFSLNEGAKGDEPPPAVQEAEAIERLLASAAEVEEGAKRAAKPARRKHEEHHFALSSNAIDLDSILGEFETMSKHAHAAPHDVEVDLSIDIDGIKQGQPFAIAPPPAAEAEDLESVFGTMRQQQARRSGLDEAEKEYKRGLALRKLGDIDGCIAALTMASRAPKLRFATSWLIARTYRDRGMVPQALEWLGRAAQATAPNADDGHLVLYELADLLEQSGESARSLAVCMELESEAPGYRDVAGRIDRLTKVQAEG